MSSKKNKYDDVLTERDKRMLFAIFSVALFIAMGLFTAIITNRDNGMKVYSLQEYSQMLNSNTDVTPYYTSDDSISTSKTVTPPTMTQLGGIWSGWRNGIRLIYWQEGTFKVSAMKLLPSSAGKVGGVINEILVYTNLPNPSMTDVWINEGYYFSLFKFNGIFPYPVDAKAYPPRTGGWTTFGNDNLKFENANLKFAVSGVYIMAVHLEIDRMTMGGITHEKIDFYTDPFYIGSSGSTTTSTSTSDKISNFFTKII